GYERGNLKKKSFGRVSGAKTDQNVVMPFRISCGAGVSRLWMPQPAMRIARQLTLEIFEIDLVPAFGHFAINVSAARTDVETDLPPRCGYTHDLRHVGSADIQIRFDDVVSLKTHSDDKNM